jgi:hypothetical protein
LFRIVGKWKGLPNESVGLGLASYDSLLIKADKRQHSRTVGAFPFQNFQISGFL